MKRIPPDAPSVNIQFIDEFAKLHAAYAASEFMAVRVRYDEAAAFARMQNAIRRRLLEIADLIGRDETCPR